MALKIIIIAVSLLNILSFTGCSYIGTQGSAGLECATKEEAQKYVYGPSLTQKILYDRCLGKIKSGNIHPLFKGDASKILREARLLGLNCISVPVHINVENALSSTMSVNPCSKARAIKIIKALQANGMPFILEPYPWIDGGAIYETSWDPVEKVRWFANWQDILKELAEDISIPYDAYAMVIASNYQNMEYGYHNEWISIINFLRGLDGFESLITYRTNFWVTADWAPETQTYYEKKLNNPLFSKLDFISIAFYFELNNEEAVPPVERLKADLKSVSKFNRGQNVYKEVENFYIKHRKPIFFGELGAPKRKYAASEPWNAEPNYYDFGDIAKFSQLAQANYFQAVLETFQGEDWFHGMGVFAIGWGLSSYSLY